MPRFMRSKKGRPMKKRYGRKRTVNKRKLARQVHYFKRTVNLGSLTASITSAGVPTPISTGLSFNLAQLPGVTDFTSLFDQYKINGIKYSLVPTANSAILSGVSNVASGYGFQRLNSVIDYDDDSQPTGEDQLLQYGSLKTTPPMRTHVRYFKPKVDTEVFQSGVTTGYAPRGNMWIDVNNSTVKHYGLKLYANAPVGVTNTAASITYTAYATFYIACKNVR